MKKSWKIDKYDFESNILTIQTKKKKNLNQHLSSKKQWKYNVTMKESFSKPDLFSITLTNTTNMKKTTKY